MQVGIFTGVHWKKLLASCTSIDVEIKKFSSLHKNVSNSSNPGKLHMWHKWLCGSTQRANTVWVINSLGDHYLVDALVTIVKAATFCLPIARAPFHKIHGTFFLLFFKNHHMDEMGCETKWHAFLGESSRERACILRTQVRIIVRWPSWGTELQA